MSYGLAGEIVSTGEAARLVPVLDPGGPLRLPRPLDGLAGRRLPPSCGAAPRSGAREFNGLTRVTGVRSRGGRVRGVETTRRADRDLTLVVCAGIWGPEMQGLVGRPIPMQPMQHLFAWTNPLPSSAGATTEAAHAILRHQDRDAYYRQRGEQYGIGCYAHDPLPIDVPELNRGKGGHPDRPG